MIIEVGKKYKDTKINELAEAVFFNKEIVLLKYLNGRHESFNREDFECIFKECAEPVAAAFKATVEESDRDHIIFSVAIPFENFSGKKFKVTIKEIV